jgi:hypothetical protein
MSKMQLNDKQELPYCRVRTVCFVMCVGRFGQKFWYQTKNSSSKILFFFCLLIPRAAPSEGGVILGFDCLWILNYFLSLMFCCFVVLKLDLLATVERQNDRQWIISVPEINFMHSCVVLVPRGWSNTSALWVVEPSVRKDCAIREWCVSSSRFSVRDVHQVHYTFQLSH